MLLMLCAALFMSLTTSCSDKDDDDNKTTPETPEEQQDIKMPELKEDFESIVEWMTQAVKYCHPYISKYWNEEANPANFNLLLVNGDRTKLYMINAEGKTEVPEKDWDDVLRDGMAQVETAGYFFLPFKNKHCCLQIVSQEMIKDMNEKSMMMTGKPLSMKQFCYEQLHTFYHESFHEYVQKLNEWKKDSEDSSRDQVYPILYEPRIYRKMALLALLKAWENPAEQAAQYARAKYWLQKYEKECADEALSIKETDVDESTAEYFCRSIIHSVFKDYDVLYGITGKELSSGVSNESYQQSIAMHLIFRDGRLNEAMPLLKKHELTPINILLKNVTVPANYDESQDAADIKMIRAALDEQYTEANPYMAPLIKLVNLHKQGKAVYVVTRRPGGAFYSSSSGTYTLTDLPGFVCEVNFAASFPDVEFRENTMLVYQNIEHCIPVGSVDNLELSDWQDLWQSDASFLGIECPRQATLNAVKGADTFELKNLPVTVVVGKDALGNQYYCCRASD